MVAAGFLKLDGVRSEIVGRFERAVTGRARFVFGEHGQACEVGRLATRLGRLSVQRSLAAGIYVSALPEADGNEPQVGCITASGWRITSAYGEVDLAALEDSAYGHVGRNPLASDTRARHLGRRDHLRIVQNRRARLLGIRNRSARGVAVQPEHDTFNVPRGLVPALSFDRQARLTTPRLATGDYEHQRQERALQR